MDVYAMRQTKRSNGSDGTVGRMPHAVQERRSIVQVRHVVVQGELLVGGEGLEAQSRFPEKRLDRSDLSVDVVGVNLAKLVLEAFRVLQLLVIPMREGNRILIKNALQPHRQVLVLNLGERSRFESRRHGNEGVCEEPAHGNQETGNAKDESGGMHRTMCK